MADNMIERVAEALSDLDDFGEEHIAWEDCDEDWKNQCRVGARIAIKAMRLPTDKMIDAGGYAHCNNECPEGFWPPDVWQAMIDAALNEGGND